MVLLSILSVKPYIPSTLLGLLGLIAGYVYYYFKNRNEQEVAKIKAMPVAQRPQALDALINELGVRISTDDMDTTQRFELVKRIMRMKVIKWLIISATCLALAVIIAFLLYHDRAENGEPAEPITVKTTTAVIKGSRPSDITRTLDNLVSNKDFEQVLSVAKAAIENDDGNVVAIIYSPYVVLACEKTRRINAALKEITKMKNQAEHDFQIKRGFISDAAGIQSLQYGMSSISPLLADPEVIKAWNALNDLLTKNKKAANHATVDLIAQLKKDPNAQAEEDNNSSSRVREYILEQAGLHHLDSLYLFYPYFVKTNSQAGVQYLAYPAIAISYLKRGQQEEYLKVLNALKEGMISAPFLQGFGGTQLAEQFRQLRVDITGQTNIDAFDRVAAQKNH
jgi:hypothetical protein